MDLIHIIFVITYYIFLVSTMAFENTKAQNDLN